MTSFTPENGIQMSNTLLDQLPQPGLPRTAGAASKQITALPWNASIHWLALGWRDVASKPVASLFYGLPFWCMALILNAVFEFEPEYSMMAIAICLLLGPFGAMALYDASRRRGQGIASDFYGSLTCWKQYLPSLGMHAGLLMVLSLLWGRVSLVVTALFFDTLLPADFDVIEAALSANNWGFVVAYAAVGGAFAALVFGLSVVSVPMILDRNADAITASITSLAVVKKNVAVMLLWALQIVLLVGASVMLPLAVGLAVVGPLLGHASWHAYRDCVR